MEREIKFRGRTIPFKEKGYKYDGEWVYGFYHVDHNGNHFIIKNKENGRMYPGVKVIPETVGQFTGLFDKNGKEIYEGDVVIHLEATEPEEKGFLCMFKDFRIKFMNVNFLEDDFYSTVNYEYVKNNTEIIGNIHDNPELLK